MVFFLIVGVGWVFSVCVHEFAHAVVAYRGGDRTVADKGYLTMNPLKYTHVATVAIRRLDLTWTGAEVSDYDAAKAKAGTGTGAMPRFVKEALRRAVRGNGHGPNTAKP